MYFCPFSVMPQENNGSTQISVTKMDGADPSGLGSGTAVSHSPPQIPPACLNLPKPQSFALAEINWCNSPVHMEQRAEAVLTLASSHQPPHWVSQTCLTTHFQHPGLVQVACVGPSGHLVANVAGQCRKMSALVEQ